MKTLTPPSRPCPQGLSRSIVEFVSQCRGLSLLESGEKELIIYQRVDGKCLPVKTNHITEVIPRSDNKKEQFLQINFMNNKKIILTDGLVGFKPVIGSHLNANRLPKVVTTPDLVSFIETLEEAFYDATAGIDEIEDVREYFDSILQGGEAVGFNLMCERLWATRLLSHQISVGSD